MPKIKGLKESLSRKRRAVSSDTKGKTQSSRQDLQKLKLYSSIEDLPLLTFWKICITGNLHLLEKDTEAYPDDVLMQTWEAMGYQYAEAMGQRETGEGKKEWSANILRFKASYVGVCVEALRVNKSEVVLSCLKKIFPSLAFNVENEEEFNQDMIRAIGMSKNWVVEYMQLENMLNAAEQERLSRAGKNTLEYYYESLTPLKKYMGFHIDPKVYTVLEYCVDVQTLIKENLAKQKAALRNARNNK